MTLKTHVIGLLEYARGDDVQTYLQRWLAQSLRLTDGLFDPVTGHNHAGSGTSGAVVGCLQVGSYVGALSWTLGASSVWTETPIQTTVALSGVRTRIEFGTMIGCPTKGQRVFWTIMIDGNPPVGTAALGAADAPENNYGLMASGTYYITPAAGSRRVALALYGPSGAQLFNVIASTLYLTEQHP